MTTAPQQRHFLFQSETMWTYMCLISLINISSVFREVNHTLWTMYSIHQLYSRMFYIFQPQLTTFYVVSNVDLDHIPVAPFKG